MAEISFKRGDAVIVKPDVKDPDLNINLDGWQGRISEIDPQEDIICIQWDSLTLKQMPAEMIDHCEEEGLDWTNMHLHPEDVVLTSLRDSQNDVIKMIEILEKEHRWSYLAEEGQRIQAVLAKAKDDSDRTTFKVWEAHLKKVLKFPFEAEISEWQERGPLRTGDKVTVLEIEGCEDLYGILVAVRHKRGNYVFPLCDLEATDKSSSNYEPVSDYAVWFANR